jgi:hypothetical protein
MVQPSTPGNGPWAVAQLLAGAPAAHIDAQALADPWHSVVQALATAGGDERLAAFEGALCKLPADQAADIRLQVGRAGRVLLRGERAKVSTPLLTVQSDVPDLPQAACVTPALERAGQAVGRWLNDYVAYAAEVSERTPRLFHEAIGLWIGGLAIARRLRLRLRHGDLYPNLYLLGVADTTLYAKSTGLDIGSRLVHDTLPHLLFVNDFTPEAMLADLAGREPVNLKTADLTEQDRDLWLAGRNFAAQRGIMVEEASALLGGLKRDYMVGMAELLLRLYDCPELYRRNTRGAGFVVVRKACLSIIGVTTPARLERAEIDTAWHDGLFARFGLLTPESPPQRPGDDYERPRPPCPPHLAEGLIRLAHSLLPVPAYPAPVEAREVAMADEAKAAWWRYYVAVTYDLLSSSQPPDRRLWGSYGRFPAQALKIALILAALDWADGRQEEPQVTLAHYARGQAIAERWRGSAHRLLNTLSHSRVADEVDAEARVMRLIRASGATGMTARSIYRTLGLRRVEFDLAVIGLMRDGLVQEIEIKPPRGPSACGYVAVENLSP